MVQIYDIKEELSRWNSSLYEQKCSLVSGLRDNDSRSSLSSNQLTFLIFTAANEVCEGYVLCLSVSYSVQKGGVVSQHALQVVSQHGLAGIQRGVVSQHALQVPRPTPRGEVEGSGLGGVFRPIPRGALQAHTLRAVRILLECILVMCKIQTQYWYRLCY